MSAKLVLLSLLSFVTFAGPILLSIGIALFIVPSDRKDWIKQFHNAGKDFNPSELLKFGRNATINSRVPVVNRVKINPIRDQANLDEDVYSTYLSTTVGLTALTNITIGYDVITHLPGTYELFKTAGAIAHCDYNDGCSVAEMNKYCTTKYGPEAVFTSDKPCKEAGQCYECVFRSYITSACVVVDRHEYDEYYIKDILTNVSVGWRIVTRTFLNNGVPTTEQVNETIYNERLVPTTLSRHIVTFKESATYKSCFYPFTAESAQYGAVPMNPTMEIAVRDSADPFITIQRLTEGTMDFGPSINSDRRAGVGLVVVGTILTFFFIVLCVFWKRVYDAVNIIGASEPAKE